MKSLRTSSNVSGSPVRSADPGSSWESTRIVSPAVAADILSSRKRPPAEAQGSGGGTRTPSTTYTGSPVSFRSLWQASFSSNVGSAASTSTPSPQERGIPRQAWSLRRVQKPFPTTAGTTTRTWSIGRRIEACAHSYLQLLFHTERSLDLWLDILFVQQ